MIGALIGAGLSIGGSIFGGISASRAAKKLKKQIASQQADNRNWYNRRYNEDATQRADAQRILTITQDRMRAANRNAAGTQAVMGGTEESVAATKAANAQAMADAAAQISAQGESRKDKVEAQYLTNEQHYQDQLNNIQAAKAGAIGQAIQGVTSAAGNIATAIDSAYDDPNKPQKPKAV